MKRASFLTIAFMLVFMAGAAPAVQHATAPQSDRTGLDRLEQEIATLREQINQLLTLKPSFTSFMPVFSERFHVMHYAGEAGDWAVAAHELSELERLLQVAVLVDRKNGELMRGFLSGHFARLGIAIHHARLDTFLRELDQTVASCNGSCHTAAGSPFIRVTLDATDALSIRHAHTLERSPPPGHMHRH